jgi:hypothetical protein
MAFNLGASLKSNLKSSVVNTVSQTISSAVPGVGGQLINTALRGGDVKGALLGAARDTIGNQLLGGIQNKLGGLIANAEELTGIASNPLKIVERGIADLAGISGGEYGVVLDQFRELSDRSSITPNFIDRGFMPSYKGDDSSASKLPNPLRNHNGFNYVITLGVLDAAEYNNPELYRSAGGFKNYVIKSSGGNLDKRYQVFDETVGNTYSDFGDAITSHAEYYIDDINLESVVAPNPNTRLTSGTSLTFTVTEPYSMGNFIQSIIGSASDAGYGSYTQAPFCLKIDFVGWNLGGDTDANFLQQPIFIPIQIINMDFNVSGAGSKYEVKAVPMSETGLSDNINKINSAVRASGTFVHEVLETNDQSLTGTMNRAIEDMEEAGALAPYDRYVICFPKTRQALRDALQAGNIDESAFTTSPEEQEDQRRGYTGPDDGLRGSFSPEIIKVSQPNQIYSVLKSFAENTSQMNAIGVSPLNEDTNAAGNSGEADAEAATDPDSGLVDPGNQATQPAEKARDFQFQQGQQITSIIERIVTQSTYAAEKATEESTNGMNKWFRIDTQVFIDESALTESTMGRRPKIYVYSVIEYEVDEAVTAAPNKRPKNTAGLRGLALKEYNYIYTGKNEDVLNFDINFNNAFMMSAYADLGMNAAPLRDPDNTATTSSGNGTDSGVVTSPPTDQSSNDDPTGGTQLVNAVAEATATTSNDVRRRIAEMFHDRITNMTVDMVTAEMEIMGDPYFIPQQTGNYVASNGANPNITNDGTMNYLDSSVFCIINFRTPFDYQVKGATMEFPQIVPGFSGIFQIWAVTNNFSSGKFTQTLKLIRSKGRDDEETTGSSFNVQVDNSAALNKDGVQSDGTVGVSARAGTDCEPSPVQDDIRRINPAIGLDAFGGAGAAIENVSGQLTSLLDGKDGPAFGIAELPDLTKVIPSVPVGRYSSARLPGVMGSIRPGDETNALDAIAAQAAVVNQARDAALGNVNNAVDSVTDAAKSRARSLLGN